MISLRDCWQHKPRMLCRPAFRPHVNCPFLFRARKASFGNRAKFKLAQHRMNAHLHVARRLSPFRTPSASLYGGHAGLLRGRLPGRRLPQCAQQRGEERGKTEDDRRKNRAGPGQQTSTEKKPEDQVEVPTVDLEACF